mmetsp:Transcript_33583/g.24618  ORF Transcript_33583/g.24618 Transcript_33583/m.24618 type:complete len:111 (+) Transcript_33583:133-465(+)
MIMLTGSMVGQILLVMVLFVFSSEILGLVMLLSMASEVWYIWYIFDDTGIESVAWNLIFKASIIANPILQGILAVKMVSNPTSIVAFAFNLIAMILMSIYVYTGRFENRQ